MRIESISIKNFRSFKDCKVTLGAYTSLIGPNGSGKSTVMEALNVFFCHAKGSTTNVKFLGIEDFHQRNKQPIEITVTFHNLSPAAQNAFSDYVHDDKLIILAIACFDEDNGTEVVHYVQQHDTQDIGTPIENVLPPEEPPDDFRENKSLLAPYVQWLYVPAAKDITKETVDAHGTTLGEVLLYAVQAGYPFISGIQEIRKTALKQYRELLDQNRTRLDRLSKSLDDGLARWAHPGANARLEWIDDAEKSVQIDSPSARLFTREGGFEGEITRFGHGLQRSYFLALIEILASEYAEKEVIARHNERDAEVMAMDGRENIMATQTGKEPKKTRVPEVDPTAPTLILGCEEPEIYQHPPQARHLADVLEKLSEKGAQVLISTHSPYFVSGSRFERLRMVRRDNQTQQSNVSSASLDKISERMSEITGEELNPPTLQQTRLHQALQPHLSEMFFANKIVFVEGLEDVAYITMSLMMFDRWNCFRGHGAHILPVHGKSSLIKPLVVAEALGIPTFAIFDADGDKEKAEKRKAKKENADDKEDQETGRCKENKRLLTLLDGNPKIPFPEKTAWCNRFVQWPNNLGATLKSDVGKKVWDDAGRQANDRLGHPNGGFDKHQNHIGYRLEILREASAIPQSLDTLCQKIIKFSETH